MMLICNQNVTFVTKLNLTGVYHLFYDVSSFSGKGRIYAPFAKGKMEGSKTKRKQNCYRLGDEKVVDSVLPHGESFGIMESLF